MILKRNFYPLFGSVFLILSLTLFSFSALNLFKPAGEKNFDALKDTAFKTCMKTANKLSVEAKANGRKTAINFTIDGLDKWQENIALSSILISNCPDFKLKSFCAGTDCSDKINKKDINGITFMLLHERKK